MCLTSNIVSYHIYANINYRVFIYFVPIFSGNMLICFTKSSHSIPKNNTNNSYLGKKSNNKP